MTDPHQDAAPDGVNHALGGVQARNQNEQGDQRRHAAAWQNAIVDFKHEQRAGEHQKIAHAAERGGRDKGSPARAERGGKFGTHGLLLRRTGGVVHLMLRTILEDAGLRAACNDRRSTILARRGELRRRL